jgi:AhpD family alkylhydroperoxidase
MGTATRTHYSVREIYRITLLALRTTRAARHARCDPAASERVMLAVTEVNGCEICSYAHTRRALEAGLSDAEVRELLGGVTAGVPDGQLAGIAFAQHYADTRGHPDPAAWTELVDRHGAEQALCVLRAIRLIMWGNALGIPLGSLRSRAKGAPERGSSLSYETRTLLGSALVTPVALVHALVEDGRGVPFAP